MKVLYPWLKEFVEFTASPAELVARLSLAGVPVESLEDSPAGPRLDVEVFSNRGDLLGHHGIAREIAAIFRTRLKPFRPGPREAAERIGEQVGVAIECPELCGRFTARLLRGVRVGPSPDWLRQRLEALDQPSINNVVDATNYVMFELGHPLHAFDFDRLAGGRIVVRRGRPGEKMRTLDGIERALTPEMCLVCDAARAVGIAGVMGGAESEIGPASRNVLLECAWFDPVSIRRTSKSLGLRTQASMRFERAADPELAELASRRCAELIQQLAGGELAAGVVDVYPSRRPAAAIELTRRELLRVMGADVPDREIEEILAALGFAPVRADHNRGTAGSLAAAWACTRPSWRGDVAREIDLVEEVARHYGFDNFPPRLPAARQPAARLTHAEAEDRIRERLLALGYDEIITIPLVDAARDALFCASGGLRITNPLAEDASVLRGSGIPNMVQALEWNINRGQRDVRLFEIGRRYEAGGDETREPRILTLGATGAARAQSLHEPGRAFEFSDLKGEIDALGALVGGLSWEPGGPEWLDAARAGRLALGGQPVGVAGRLARRTAESLKLRQDVFLAELQLDPLYEGYARARAALQYQPLPRFPVVERDFSLLLADGTTFAQVRDVLRSLKIAELDRIEAVDRFRGGSIPPGRYSLLVRVTFQSHTATLTEAQLTDFTGRIVGALEERLGATLRAS